MKKTKIGKSAAKWTRGAARFIATAIFLGFLAMFAAAAGPEVVDISASGFTTRNTASIAAPPGEVYAGLVKNVGQWWNPEHTDSRNAGNLSIDDRAGGGFLEKLPGGGSVLHFTVVNAQPGKLLRLVGAMGPLQALGVNGSLTWQFKPEGSGTSAELIYSVGGYSPGGLQSIAPLADKVLNEQLQRLKAFVEKK